MNISKRIVKKIVIKNLLFVLPFAMMTGYVFVYLIPSMEKTIMTENELFLEHMIDILDKEFRKIDQIREVVEQKKIVKSLYSLPPNQVYNPNNSIVELVEFLVELNSINNISSITSTIGVYNKRNNIVYYNNTYSDVDWFFGKTCEIDNQSSGYWIRFFDDVQYNTDVKLLGPFDYKLYPILNKGSTEGSLFLYAAPINMSLQCQAVFFAFIDLQKIKDILNALRSNENSRVYLVGNIGINLNEEPDDYLPVGIDFSGLSGTLVKGDYIITALDRLWWNQEWKYVVYDRKSFKKIIDIKRHTYLTMLTVFVCACIYNFISNMKLMKIEKNRDMQLIISYLIRMYYNSETDCDITGFLELKEKTYLVAVTYGLEDNKADDTVDGRKVVAFTCDQKTIIVICSDNDYAAERLLNTYTMKNKIKRIGVAKPCRGRKLHDALNQALRAYDTAERSVEDDALVYYDDYGDADNGLSSENNKRILEYINVNFDNPNISLKDIAGHFHIEASNISRRFQIITGEHFHSYLTTLRIKKACRLLAETKETVNTISKLSGYENPVSFRRTFKQAMGLSPSDYRNSRVLSDPQSHSTT